MKLLDWTIDQIGRARFYPLPHLISFLIWNYDTVSFGKVDKTIRWRKVRIKIVNI